MGNAEVDAQYGNRPSGLHRRAASQGELVGSIPDGPRQELRVYQLGGEIFIARWKADLRSPETKRWVPCHPGTYGFLLISEEVGAALSKLLK